MDLEIARQQWQDGDRRVEDSRPDRERYVDLVQQVDLIVSGLRKRVGQVFTLAELAEAYDGADEWARELLESLRPALLAALARQAEPEWLWSRPSGGRAGPAIRVSATTMR